MGWEETQEGGDSWAVRTFAVERGGRYILTLTPSARAALERRGALRYATLYEQLDGMTRIQQLSTAFYRRVFASDVVQKRL